MKRTLINCCVLCMTMTLLAGCGNEIPEMDETTRKLVVEYAAATVKDNDSNRTSRLLEKEELEIRLAEEAELQAILSQKSTPVVEEAQKTDQESTSNETVASQEVPQLSLQEVMALNNLAIEYAGYEVTDSYPQNSEGTYFTMDALNGNKLVVLKFNVTNSSGNDQAMDIIGNGMRFKISVNGESKNILTTMLLNDLANYQGIIANDSSQEFVLISEIPDSQAQEVNSLSLYIKNGDKSTTISLN